jgi:hypothetical protein
MHCVRSLLPRRGAARHVLTRLAPLVTSGLWHAVHILASMKCAAAQLIPINMQYVTPVAEIKSMPTVGFSSYT